jgi:hypothetical protein
MRRKSIFGVLLLTLCLCVSVAHSQTITAVSGTIVDPAGTPYANATLKAQIVPVAGGVSPYVTATAAPLIAPFYTKLDAKGTFLISLVANDSVTPASTYWQFTISIAPGVPLPFGTGNQSFSSGNITVSGATQSLTATLNALAPCLTQECVGGMSVATASGASYVATCNNNTIVSTYGSTNQTISLPNTYAVGKTFTIKIGVGGSVPINITAVGSAAIDAWSGAQYQLGYVASGVPTTTATGGSVTLRWDGTQYWIVGQI